jgi:DNA-binding NarL/FixJ family response regulator
LLRRTGQISVQGETESASEARELLARHEPKLLITGLTLRGGDGVELIRDLRRLSPQTRAVVLTARTDAASMQRAFRAGARGYVAVQDTTDTLLQALTEVLRGELFASVTVSRYAVETFVTGTPFRADAVNTLSDRQWHIFRRLGAGDGPMTLARALRVSVKTVETHQARIKEKLGCRTAAELHAQAARWALSAMRRHRA